MMVIAKIMDIATEGRFADAAGAETKPSLQVFRRGNARFALLIDEIATIAEWRKPTPLPQAPPAVLGVVSVAGRMLTVLDPAVLLEEQSDGTNSETNFIVALRGDEQLALLVDEKGATLAAEVNNNDAASGVMLGVIKHDEEKIGVIDRTKLFGLAIRGRERRQRRF